MKILFVEDDLDIRSMYGSQLELADYRVFYAQTAQETLDILDDGQFDLVVLDILLSGSNGLAVLQELQSYEDWRGIPVIVLSNVTTVDLAASPKHLRDLGVVKYLVKIETTPKDLLSAVEQCLSRRSKQV